MGSSAEWLPVSKIRRVTPMIGAESLSVHLVEQGNLALCGAACAKVSRSKSWCRECFAIASRDASVRIREIGT